MKLIIIKKILYIYNKEFYVGIMFFAYKKLESEGFQLNIVRLQDIEGIASLSGTMINEVKIFISSLL